MKVWPLLLPLLEDEEPVLELALAEEEEVALPPLLPLAELLDPEPGTFKATLTFSVDAVLLSLESEELVEAVVALLDDALLEDWLPELAFEADTEVESSSSSPSQSSSSSSSSPSSSSIMASTRQ